MQGLDTHSSTSGETETNAGECEMAEAWKRAADRGKQPPTLADVRPGVEGVALGALAGEAARGVPAQAVLAQQPVDQALVDI